MRWQFVGSKAKNVTPEQKAAGWGDAWTWVALDADTKLCISYLVGGRDTGWATDITFDIRQRVIGRPQITTDAHKPYLAAIEMACWRNPRHPPAQALKNASRPVSRNQRGENAGVPRSPRTRRANHHRWSAK